jgi:hypothetical protein
MVISCKKSLCIILCFISFLLSGTFGQISNLRAALNSQLLASFVKLTEHFYSKWGIPWYRSLTSIYPTLLVLCHFWRVHVIFQYECSQTEYRKLPWNASDKESYLLVARKILFRMSYDSIFLWQFTRSYKNCKNWKCLSFYLWAFWSLIENKGFSFHWCAINSLLELSYKKTRIYIRKAERTS